MPNLNTYPLSACLFDLDGGLIDSEPLHSQAWQETTNFFGSKLSASQLELLRGRKRIDCAKLISKWMAKKVHYAEILKIHQPISKSLLSNAKSMSGAQEVIDWCISRKIETALVTSSSKSAVKNKCANKGWMNSLKIKIYGDDERIKDGKPNPDPYLYALRKLNIESSKTYVIEDSISGAQSGLAAGCTVWVLMQSNINLINKFNKLKENHPNKLFLINCLNEFHEHLLEVFDD